jgi:hypothetical protein
MFVKLAIFLILIAAPAHAGWIVTWDVTNSWLVPCSDSGVMVEDEFGRLPGGIQMGTSLACFDTETKSMIETFESKKEALEFIERGVSESRHLIPGSSLYNFKLFETQEQNTDQ